MEPIPVPGNASHVNFCSQCLAYQVVNRGDKCQRCAPVEQTSIRSEAELGGFVTLFVLAAIGFGTALVFLAKWLGS